MGEEEGGGLSVEVEIWNKLIQTIDSRKWHCVVEYERGSNARGGSGLTLEVKGAKVGVMEGEIDR